MTGRIPTLQGRGALPLDPDGDQPGYLPATPDTVLWGRLPSGGDGGRAVITIDPGQSLIIDTVSHEGILEDQGRDPLAYFAERGIPPSSVLQDAVAVAREVRRDPRADGPHVVTGPVHVRGAQVGDVLSMTVEHLELRCSFGIVSNRHRRGALPDEFPLGGSTDPVSVLCRVERDADGNPQGTMPAGPTTDRQVRFPLAPFLGIMGVAVSGPDRAHSVPPGAHGGNLDVRLLGEGATLHVPVQVPGALAYVGDPHYAQGDGEVALTAFEAPLRARIRFDLSKAAAPRRLWAETDDLVIPIGLDEDLAEALRECTRAAVTLLVDRGMHPAHAYAYLSAAGDFAVSQVVDQVCGVHASIRKSDLRELLMPPWGM